MAFNYDKCQHRFSKTRCDRRRRSVTYQSKCLTCKMVVKVRQTRGSDITYITAWDALGLLLAPYGTASDRISMEDRLDRIVSDLHKGVSVTTAMIAGTA